MEWYFMRYFIFFIFYISWFYIGLRAAFLWIYISWMEINIQLMKNERTDPTEYNLFKSNE